MAETRGAEAAATAHGAVRLTAGDLGRAPRRHEEPGYGHPAVLMF
ncbi:MAG TPA: hypothetical protein PLG21_06440 [Anaerolineae bacterium]|nr:hypothetical protein [Anaerolineae bacterium]HPL27683.1 hypothetical protein [Anaerolineae bacterium]